MIRAFIIASGVMVASSQAWAAPCVSATFDVPFPNATEVTSHVTDLPSSTFPAFWQEGRLDGFDYKIFANATGVLRGAGADTPWSIDVMCDASSESCTFIETGTPPEAAARVAQRIGHCLVPAFPLEEVSPEVAAPVEAADVAVSEPSIVQPVEEVSAEIADDATDDPTSPDAETVVNETPDETTIADAQVAPEEPPNVACGVALVDEITEIATMQRLLVLLGEDPGPVDGFLGPQSFTAMGAFVDNPGWGTSISDVIAQLDQLHCAGTN